MLSIVIGNIFDSNAKVLVNTINCVGVMGKGIAKEFKQRYPRMYDEYKQKCDAKEIRTGTLYSYIEDDEVRVINFPTKQHWRSPSQLSYIIDGLDWFVDNYENLGIESIAFPPLGCGNGGLNWSTVGPIMVQKLIDLPITIEIYAPHGTNKDLLNIKKLLSMNILDENQKGIQYGKINKQWLLVLQIVKCLENSKYSIKVGRVIFQKICYILTRYGADLDMSFSKGTYGPYSQDIKNMITILSNNNLIYERQLGNLMLISVSNSFKFNRNNYGDNDIQAMNKTFSLFKGIHNSSEAEIVTTILYTYDEISKNNYDVTENKLYEAVYKWKKRHNNFQDEIEIRDYIKYLSSNSLINVDYTREYKEEYF